MVFQVFLLLVIFQIKHFLADYPMQGKFMLGKFKEKGWILPLSAHCAVHAVFTFFISIFFVNPVVSLFLAGLDFVIHFIMDRIKASPKMLGRFEALSKEQAKGLAESRSLAIHGTTYPHEELSKESKRLVKSIDEKFRSNKFFWWALGFDQSVHHLTHYLIIFLIIQN